MLTLKIIKDCEYNKGDIVSLEDNEAIGLIDSGLAKMFTGKNRMMTPENSKIKYRTKIW